MAGRRGDWGRPLFLWGVRKRCGLTLREAGEAAGGMKLAAVDKALRRLGDRSRGERRIDSLQRMLLRAIDAEKSKVEP